jgi:hypothetical protein
MLRGKLRSKRMPRRLITILLGVGLGVGAGLTVSKFFSAAAPLKWAPAPVTVPLPPEKIAWENPPLPEQSAIVFKLTRHDGAKVFGQFACTSKNTPVKIREFYLAKLSADGWVLENAAPLVEPSAPVAPRDECVACDAASSAAPGVSAAPENVAPNNVAAPPIAPGEHLFFTRERQQLHLVIYAPGDFLLLLTPRSAL